MTSVCPSCSQPLSAVTTPGRSRETLESDEVIVCDSCGFVISQEQVAETGDVVARSDPAPSVTQRRVAHFHLGRLLGKGGFGAVWLAEDMNLGRRVALKLPKSMLKDAKLLHEAKTAAKLKHPNIVSIYEVGTSGDQVYIASEYIDGVNLRESIESERLPVDQTVDLVKTVSRAVQHAHSHGVVHRDLKPENIILDSESQPHVTDFGIAKQVSENETISTDGQVIGTIAYMSPEQARGNTRETDHRSDVYAIGTMFFEMLTEYRPYRGNLRGIIHQKLYEDPPSPRKLVPLLPKDLETICLKCLEREPGKRYQSAAALGDELERFQQGIPIQSRPVSRLEKAFRWSNRNKAVCGLMLGVFFSLLIGLMGTSYFWLRSERSSRQRQQALYRTHMVLASDLWSRGDITGLRNTLMKYEPGSVGSDQRDFEWYYFTNCLTPLVQIADHGDAVVGVDVSRTGSLFASAGRDRVIRVWDTETGDLVRTLQARAGPIGMIEFSPKTDRLLSTHSDGQIRLWNPKQHDKEAAVFEHGKGLVAARFDSSGESIVSIDASGSARWWNLASRAQTKQIDDLGPSVRDLAYSPNGDRLVIASVDGTHVVLDTESDERLHQTKVRVRPRHVVFAGDNDSLVSGGGNDRITQSSVDGTVELQGLGFDGVAVGDIEYLHESNQIVAVLSNNNLVLFGKNGRETRSLPTHSLSHGVLGQSGDGRFLAVGSGDGTVKLLDVDALQAPQVDWHDSHVRDVAFVGSGERVITCAGDGSIHSWSPATGKGVELLEASGREMLSLAAGSNSSRAYAAGMFSEMMVIDPIGQSMLDSIPLPLSGFGSLAVSLDNRLLAAGSRSGVVLVYEVAKPTQPMLRINQPDTQVTQLLFSPDGGTLAIGYSNKQVTLVSLGDANASESLTLHSAAQSIVFSESGETLVVGTQTGDLCFVDLASGSVDTIDAHQGRINAIDFFPGCKRLVSGGRDKKINIWDVDSRELVAILYGHDKQVFALDVAPDGKMIASAGLDGDLRLWRTQATD